MPLSEGPNELRAEAVDRAGNSAQATRSVILDTQAPAISIEDPAAGTLVPGDAITVSGSVVEPHLDRVEVNGYRATVAATTWSVRVPLAEGVNTLAARAVDRLGRSSAATVAIIRDSSAPAIAILQPGRLVLDLGERSRHRTAAAEDGLVVTVNGTPTRWSRVPSPPT